jgi:hypothetical protein
MEQQQLPFGLAEGIRKERRNQVRLAVARLHTDIYVSRLCERLAEEEAEGRPVEKTYADLAADTWWLGVCSASKAKAAVYAARDLGLVCHEIVFDRSGRPLANRLSINWAGVSATLSPERTDFIARLPGATERLPGATERLPGATERLPGATERLPGATERLPGATTRSNSPPEDPGGETPRVRACVDRIPTVDPSDDVDGRTDESLDWEEIDRLALKALNTFANAARRWSIPDGRWPDLLRAAYLAKTRYSVEWLSNACRRASVSAKKDPLNYLKGILANTAGLPSGEFYRLYDPIQIPAEYLTPHRRRCEVAPNGQEPQRE